MVPTSAQWPLREHTLGKHLVLERYLQAWLPIMATQHDRILFIDGFAGPGYYSTGEAGSPIIALRALASHSAKERMSAEVCFVFIERDPGRAEILKGAVGTVQGLPQGCKVHVVSEPFSETMTSILDRLDRQGKALAPSFVMVDPFGVSGTPMRVLRRILANPSSELFVSFMYESINRFSGTPEFEPHLDELFGTGDWRDCRNVKDASARRQYTYDLYERQLRDAGAKYVVHFELLNGQRLVYSVFYATHNLKGCDRMKEAIWKVAPRGDYMFQGSSHRQIPLPIEVDTSVLKEELLSEFGDGAWIPIKRIVDYVRSDRTLYYSGHLKKRTLAPMEDEGVLEVEAPPRRRRHAYPASIRLRFRTR